jgi:hypothetical protein
MRLRGFCLIACAACLLAPEALRAQVPPPPDPEVPNRFRAEFRAILEEEARQIERLAASLQDPGQQRAVRSAIPKPHAEPADTFHILSDIIDLPSPGTDAPRNPQLVAIQNQTIAALRDLAARAGNAPRGRYGLADRCLRAILDRNPSDPQTLKLLGYTKRSDNRWVSDHAARLLDSGYQLHPSFGWVQADWIPRLEQGQLPGALSGSRVTQWVPAAEADALRASFSDAWQIKTAAHFEIRTNAPLAEGVALARKLEALNEVFFAQLGDVVGKERLPLAARLRPNAAASARGPAPTRKHQVWYFADRQDYIDFFRKLGKDERVSLGYYMPSAEARGLRQPAPRSYFFRDPGGSLEAQATLFHETSHQLLFECAGPTRYDRNPGNFWVWEGLGTYFETLIPAQNGTWSIGSWIGPRLEEARKIFLDRRDPIPTSELVRLNQAAFLAEPAVYRHYPQAMALTLFLLHSDQAAYREAFLDFVTEAYHGRARAGTLSELLGLSYEVLDQRLARFIAQVSTDAREPGQNPRDAATP